MRKEHFILAGSTDRDWVCEPLVNPEKDVSFDYTIELAVRHLGEGLSCSATKVVIVVLIFR